ncbi:MAG: cobaltochelatase subunit CobN [Desulfuromonas sp.]|nr:cobaltochelatase subunit CobN [Desulfuromonas sp.]
MKRLFLIAFLLVVLTPTITLAGKLSLLVIETNSYLAQQALQSLDLPSSIDARFFTLNELTDNSQPRSFLANSSVILVDVMSPSLSDYLIKEGLVAGRTIYALRGSRDDKALQKQGFVFDPQISAYFDNLSVDNVANMVRLAVHKKIDPAVSYGSLQLIENDCLYHPDAPQRFSSLQDYKAWYATSAGYSEHSRWVGLCFFVSTLQQGQVEAAAEVIRKVEKAGFNVLPCFGSPGPVLNRYLKRVDGKAPVDMLLAFTLKFWSALNEQVRRDIQELDIPVFNVIRSYAGDIDDWRKSPIGLSPIETAWAVDNPETAGAIEPTLLCGKSSYTDPQTGKTLYVYATIDETLDMLLPRLQMWAALQGKANAEKKVAILYYNHSQGKHNIGASYLNVFRSLQAMLKRMGQEGYRVEGTGKLTEKSIKEMILKTGRNIGSWAPGELDAMLAAGDAVRVPIEEYKLWFAKLPEDFRSKVLAQWGGPETSEIMTKDGDLIFPMVKLGNLVLMPEPSRGWSDSPMKLYHDPTLYPHHQYIAAYLWLSEKFGADAMVHLGTHATHEWLPGKQVALAPSDPPEVLIGAIPNIYPYIIDDVGEGIQAKRRGRGVIIGHLTPPMKEADLYNEYAQLKKLMEKYELAKARGGSTAAAYLEELSALATKLGLLKDLGLERFDAEAVMALDGFLHEIDTNSLPYGIHTFGTPYSQQAARDTVALIMKANPDEDRTRVEADLAASARQEMDNYIRALNGRYIPAAEGNDPIRNRASIPTGRNFYGFSPAKVPSKAAWELGKKAAIDLIEQKLKEDGTYPEKVAMVLWAVETIRNEGLNESTILYLIGLEPVWDTAGRVKGTRVIPGKELGRPRIDVLINPSGLYRDLFPDKLLFIDTAIQKALVQTDIENLLVKNTARIKKALKEAGMSEQEAQEQSRFRIFTEKPGSYGNGVSEMVGASGFWESDEEISKVFMNRSQFAIGGGKWGVPVKQAFRENLRDVDTAVHSISSNVYGTMDNDDFFQYLGGLSLAVKNVRGQAPDTRVTMQRKRGEVRVEKLAKTIGRELRTRYLNPEWIEGMKKENYAGAREMAKFVEYMWGWQVTVPDAMDKARWEQTFEVYVEDKYGQELKEFFNKNNPWAYQSLTARMLEAVRKDYWQAEEKVTQKLAVEYAVSMVEKGVACCDHTCNNPALNQMVVNIVSVPGVLSPEMVERFKMAIEKMAQKTLEQQVEDHQALQKQLVAGFVKESSRQIEQEQQQQPQKDKAQRSDEGQEQDVVEGYKMEEVRNEDESTQMTSSGVQWLASLFVLGIMLAVVLGIRHRRRSRSEG